MAAWHEEQKKDRERGAAKAGGELTFTAAAEEANWGLLVGKIKRVEDIRRSRTDDDGQFAFSWRNKSQVFEGRSRQQKKKKVDVSAPEGR